MFRDRLSRGYAAWWLAVAVSATCGICVPVAVGAPQPIGDCPVASGGGQGWAFRTGLPFHGSRGGYAHGHGSIAGARARGQACEITRAPGSTDAEIVLTLTPGPANLERGITVGGVRGARLLAPVKVSRSSDPACTPGTRGTVVLFSSYNGAGRDSVRLTFARACGREARQYSGPTVHVALPA